MSDDIDIEEHDVLENPRIKNIFPDISSIKTEVIDYEETYEDGGLYDRLSYPDDENPGLENETDHYQNDKTTNVQNDNALRYPQVGSLSYLENEETLKYLQIESVSGRQNDDNQSSFTAHSAYSKLDDQTLNYSGTDSLNCTQSDKILNYPQVKSLTSSHNEENLICPHQDDIPNSFQGENVPNSYQSEVQNKFIDDENNCHGIERVENYLQEMPMEQDSGVHQPYRSMIVLGSKPCISSFRDSGEEDSDVDSDPDVVPVTVSLTDWSLILENNSKFCAECKILFPTQNAIDGHKMSAHSFLVAVSKNIAMKSTSKSNDTVQNLDVNRKLLCSHCNKYFPDEDALLKHTYELIPHKFSPTNEKPAPVLYYICPICNTFFIKMTRFAMHMRYCHNMFNVSPKTGPLNLKCKFCNLVSSSKNAYAQHIAATHKSIFFEKASKDKFECLECNLTFPSAYSEKIHRAAKHSSEDIKLYPQSRPVPKSTLFKCNKCQIHFIFCLVALEHAKRCSLTRGDWKCPKCRRCFKVHDRIVHTQQHELSDRLKVYVVNPDLLKRIICRCLNCNISFDEKTFLETHNSGCIKSKSAECNICHINISEKSLAKHKVVHNTVANNDFIIREFVCSMTNDSTKTKLTKMTNLDEKRNEIKSNYTKNESLYKFDIAYCSICKCCMKRTKLSFHISGTCKGKPKRICKLCGLTFSSKAFISHKNDHDTKGLKLSDIKFFHIQKNKHVDPPIPEFKFCARCKVHFFSDIALTKHTCDSEDHKTCRFCNKKFSDLALKLHLPFHEYAASSGIVKSKVNTLKSNTGIPKTTSQPTIPELLLKYQSLQTIWNILYLCASCDIAFDNYDTVVEHCQDHFNNLQSYNQTIVFCDICDLKMISGCFNKHNKLHGNDVDKSAFQILRFDYQQLLRNDWLNIFGTLAEDRVKQILCKSIYNVTRSIRMELAIDGPPDLTLYQCKVCNMIVDPTDVLDHANRLECTKNDVTYFCSVCQVDFVSQKSLSEHENLHKTRTAKVSFRIISFGNKKDFFNNTLLKHMKTNDLKFIRCHHCGKLIKKSLYKAHIVKHASLKKLKQSKLKLQDRIKSKAVGNNMDKHLLELYKCSKCEICIIRQQVYRHKCVSASRLKRCNKCNNWFHKAVYKKHCLQHETYENLRVNVYLFKDNVIERDGNGQRIKVPKFKNTATSLKVSKLSKNKDVTLFYQCAKCNGSLKYKQNAKRHRCSPKVKYVKCKICGLSFILPRIQEHYDFHKRNPYSKKDFKIVTFFRNKKGEFKFNLPVERHAKYNQPKIKFKPEMKLQKSSPTDSESEVSQNCELSKVKYHIKLYRCYKCSVSFILKKLFLLHVQDCNGVMKGEKCTMCNIVLHESMFNTHLKTARCLEKKYIYVYIYARLDIRNDDTDNNNNWLYCCYECQVYFFSYKTYVYHVDIGHKAKISWCDLCNIKFGSGLEHHVRIHHQMENPLVNINVETLYTTNPDESVRHLSTIVDKSQHRQSVRLSESGKIKANLMERPRKNQNCLDTSKNSEIVHTQLTEQEIQLIEQKQLLELPRRYCLDSDNSKQPKHENILYRCHVCDIHFVNHRTLEKHIIQNNQHLIRRYTCPDCNLAFTSKSLRKHRISHQKFKEFTIMTLDEIIAFRKGSKNNSIDFEETSDLDESYDMDIQLTEQQIEVIKKKQLMEPLRKYLSKKTLPIPHQENLLYRCHVCDLHFTNYHTLEWHVIQNNQHFMRRRACPECNLTFTPLILRKHRKIHQKYKECTVMTLDDLHALLKSSKNIDLENTYVKSIEMIANEVQESKMEENETSLQDRSKSISVDCEKTDDSFEASNFKENVLTESQTKEITEKQLAEPRRKYHYRKNFKLPLEENLVYRCHVCDLHFLSPRTLEDHVIRNNLHFVPRYNCPECNLSFTHKVIKKHMVVHQNYKECIVMTLDELIAFQNSSNDMAFEKTCGNLREVTIDETQESKVDEHKMMDCGEVSTCDTVIATGCNGSNTETLLKNVRTEPETLRFEDNRPQVVKKENRLYKCNECDVYYLTAEACNDHCYNHAVLDPTEYIACKICDLQFLCESLGKHMKEHRERIFNIDDLIVTEYRGSGNDVKVVTYSASDALKSKQVTTTTHSDIE